MTTFKSDYTKCESLKKSSYNYRLHIGEVLIKEYESIKTLMEKLDKPLDVDNTLMTQIQELNKVWSEKINKNRIEPPVKGFGMKQTADGAASVVGAASSGILYAM